VLRWRKLKSNRTECVTQYQSKSPATKLQQLKLQFDSRKTEARGRDNFSDWLKMWENRFQRQRLVRLKDFLVVKLCPRGHSTFAENQDLRSHSNWFAIRFVCPFCEMLLMGRIFAWLLLISRFLRSFRSRERNSNYQNWSFWIWRIRVPFYCLLCSCQTVFDNVFKITS